MNKNSSTVSGTPSSNDTTAPETKKPLHQKLSEARQRYGKPFASEIKVGRIEPPSYVLEHIEELQRQAAEIKQSNVRKIK